MSSVSMRRVRPKPTPAPVLWTRNRILDLEEEGTMRARTDIPARTLCVALLAVLVAAPVQGADAAAPRSSGDQDAVEDGGKPKEAMFVCCQYRCSDKNGDYLLVTCGQEGCLDGEKLERCSFLSRRNVVSCKECTPRLDRGQGGGGGDCGKPGDGDKPGGKGQPDDPPGGASGSGGAPQKH
jgi:hypothetical protein